MDRRASNSSDPKPSPAQNTNTSNSMVMVAKKAASVPKIIPMTLKPQISAPSYLFSLKENPAPPFRKPGKPFRPSVLLGSIMTEEHVVEMVLASESDPENGMRKYLAKFLVDKKIIERYNISEKKFLLSYLMETVDYAAQHDFSALKLSCLLTIYIRVHQYFKWYYWTPPTAVWAFFKELMIRHTIEDSPSGQDVFDPEDCYDALTHFHTNYLSHLPLIHLITFHAHRLKFVWPFKK